MSALLSSAGLTQPTPRPQGPFTVQGNQIYDSDGRARAVGSTGEVHARSSMSLVGKAPTLTWADPRIRSLERQALIPLLGIKPVELSFQYLKALESDRVYKEFTDGAFHNTALYPVQGKFKTTPRKHFSAL